MKNRKGVIAVSLFSLLICFCCACYFADLGKASDIVSRSAVKAKTNFPTVILDAGHGGIDGGATGVDGSYEKDINLAVTLKLNDMLRLAGFDTVLTRDKDELICGNGLNSIREKKSSDLHKRMDIMKNTENSVFLSIHQNSYPGESSCGTQVFYSPNDDISPELAGVIQNNIKIMLQPDNNRKTKKSTTSVFLLYYAVKPAVMVECGFLTNKDDCSKLSDENYQSGIAFSIACSLIEYYARS